MSNIPLSLNERENLIAKNFPIEVFPKEIQEIINMYVSNLNINKDYASASILFAFAAAIGSTYKLKVKRGWQELPTIFIALVGKPGINKSAPISIFSNPLEKADKVLYDSFLEDFKKYKQQKNFKDGNNPNVIDEPIRKQLVIKDATQEALLHALHQNPHGLAGIYDELGAFLKSFNKYKSGGGGDEEVMLSLFSGKSISINRKNTEPILISNPFFSLIGGIQPQVLINLLGNNRIDNGLTHRFLFVYPDNVIREPLSENDVTEETEELFDLLIKSLLKPTDILLGNNTNRTIGLSKEAMIVYKKFRQRIDEIINNERSDAISGIYAKLDIYFLRLSLIIHLIRITCHEEGLSLLEISESSAEKADQMIDYFEYMALKVFKLMERYRDPLSDYPLEHKILYYQFPNQFTTNKAWEIAKEKVGRRTFFIMLSDDYLFTKLKHGLYEKIW
jgi:hypothetical protein